MFPRKPPPAIYGDTNVFPVSLAKFGETDVFSVYPLAKYGKPGFIPYTPWLNTGKPRISRIPPPAKYRKTDVFPEQPRILPYFFRFTQPRHVQGVSKVRLHLLPVKKYLMIRYYLMI